MFGPPKRESSAQVTSSSGTNLTASAASESGSFTDLFEGSEVPKKTSSTYPSAAPSGERLETNQSGFFTPQEQVPANAGLASSEDARPCSRPASVLWCVERARTTILFALRTGRCYPRFLSGRKRAGTWAVDATRWSERIYESHLHWIAKAQCFRGTNCCGRRAKFAAGQCSATSKCSRDANRTTASTIPASEWLSANACAIAIAFSFVAARPTDCNYASETGRTALDDAPHPQWVVHPGSSAGALFCAQALNDPNCARACQR